MEVKTESVNVKDTNSSMRDFFARRYLRCPVTTHEICGLLLDYSHNKKDITQVYEELSGMYKRLDFELNSLSTDADGEPQIIGEPIIVPDKQSKEYGKARLKEWDIHNFAKAETRLAAVEILLEGLSKNETLEEALEYQQEFTESFGKKSET
jgi:hypothetical protein